MLLRNLYSISEDKLLDIHLKEGEIKTVVNTGSTFLNENVENCLIFKEAVVFPGLINSHDHLDFNLFPKLGNKVYDNYTEWGIDIHEKNKDVINAVLKVPKELRVQWGIYKNLLNGVTTVVNHGEKLKIENELINVYQDCCSLHSVALEKHWKLKLNWPYFKQQTFVIHIGEGKDKMAHDEIDKLIKWNLFRKKLIGIHGISMNENQADDFKALVWCPDSNYFLIGRTAEINKLKQKTSIIFGTDSTVSANWNLWDQLRLARSEKQVTDAELYNMVTLTPAQVWPIGLCGKLEPNNKADLVIARRKNDEKKHDAFFNLNPEDLLLILRSGKVLLFDIELEEEISKKIITLSDFSKILINGRVKYIRGDLPGLIKKIKNYYPEADFPISI